MKKNFSEVTRNSPKVFTCAAYILFSSFFFFALSVSHALAKSTVLGKITFSNGKPAVGVVVEAINDDIDKNDF